VLYIDDAPRGIRELDDSIAIGSGEPENPRDLCLEIADDFQLFQGLEIRMALAFFDARLAGVRVRLRRSERHAEQSVAFDRGRIARPALARGLNEVFDFVAGKGIALEFEDDAVEIRMRGGADFSEHQGVLPLPSLFSRARRAFEIIL
jgi:hypothetical protein